MSVVAAEILINEPACLRQYNNSLYFHLVPLIIPTNITGSINYGLGKHGPMGKNSLKQGQMSKNLVQSQSLLIEVLYVSVK